jgi:DNA-binding transcriptional ArsR family regulator
MLILFETMAKDETEKLTTIFQALSDPTRLKLVRLLKEYKGALCVNALANRLGVTQSAVSQHLRILKQSGIVRGKRSGPFMHYTFDQAGLKQCKAAFQAALGEE